MNIYVGNISRDVTETELKDAFAAFGMVQSASIIKEKYTGESRGFGFVEMSNAEEAKRAIAALNATQMNGRTLTVNEARPQEPRTGGMILARARDRAELDRLFAEDPFQRAGYARYRVLEFHPVKQSDAFAAWASRG